MTHLKRRTILKTIAGAALGATVTIENAREAAAAPRRPFPQHRVYAAGTIRPNHRTRAQQDDDVRAAYDRWKRRYLARAGTAPDGEPIYRIAYGPLGRVYDDGTVHHDPRSPRARATAW